MSVTSARAEDRREEIRDAQETPVARPTKPDEPSLPTGWVPWVLFGVAAVLVLLDLSVPGLRPAAGLFLALVLPTWVVARRSTWLLPTSVHAVMLGLGATLFGLIVGGLVINTVLPWFAIDRPLDHLPVAVAASAAAAALLAWRRHLPLLPALPLRLVTGDALLRVAVVQWRALPTVAVAGLVLCVIGAVRLNNGAGSGVAIAGHVAAAGVLAMLLFTRRDDLRRDSIAVYAAALTLLLSTSLRGWYISGHDVQREFISFQVTGNAGHWSMNDYQTAYQACLSVNILPTIIADLTGLSGIVIFKVVLQAIAAALPIVVLLLARTLLERRLALAAVAVFVGFPTFGADLPYLVRQEIAFLFLGLAFLVATLSQWSISHRRLMVGALGCGVVLSHYSTTYLMIFTLIFGLVLHIAQGLLSARRVARLAARRAEIQAEIRAEIRAEDPGRPDAAATDDGPAGQERLRSRWWPRIRDGVSASYLREPLVILFPGVLASLLVVSWLWVGPITGSGGHLIETTRDSVSSLFGEGEDGPASADLSYGIFPGSRVGAQERMNRFATAALESRQTDTNFTYLFPYGQSLRPPTVVAPTTDPLTAVGRFVDRAVPVEQANTALRLGFAFLLQALVIVGLGALVLRRTRRIAEIDDQTRALMVGALGAIAMVVLVPGLSAEYGVLRAFQQALVLLAPVVVIGAMSILGLFTRHAARLVAAGSVLMVLVLTGVVSTLTGGSSGLLALSNTGPYHQLHYVTDAEEAGYRYIGLYAGGRIAQAEVVSDKLAANRLRYNPDGGVLVASDMYPLSLFRGSLIFLGPDTVRDGTAAEFYTGTLLTYRYPARRIERRLDLVFSSPDARIYW